MINLTEKLSFSSLYLISFVYNLARMNNSRSKSLSRLIDTSLIDWFKSIAWLDSIAWSEGFFDWSMCEESECSLNNEKNLLNDDSMYANWFSRNSLNVERCSLNWWCLLNEMRWLYETNFDDESDFLDLFQKKKFFCCLLLDQKNRFFWCAFQIFQWCSFEKFLTRLKKREKLLLIQRLKRCFELNCSDWFKFWLMWWWSRKWE
jgi:hypothetical protein